MKLDTSFVFYTAITIYSMQTTLTVQRGPHILIKSLYEFKLQTLWSEKTDERISDKTMEEDYCERFFETFVRIMYDCSEVW